MKIELWDKERVVRSVDIFDGYEGVLSPTRKCLKDNTASYATTSRLYDGCNKENFEKALEEANKLLCLAVTGSSYLDFAYSNRADLRTIRTTLIESGRH